MAHSIKHIDNPVSDILHKGQVLPEVKCNMDIIPLPIIKQHIGTLHGMSMVAVCMLDSNYRHIEMNISFDNEQYLIDFAEHVIAVWKKYEPIPSYIRSFKHNEKFLTQYNGNKLSSDTTLPTAIETFNGKKAIIDVNMVNVDYIFKLYKWSEDSPRILRLILKSI
jgi:hypothetical protein